MLYIKHEVEFLKVGIFIIKEVVLLYVIVIFQLNTEICLTTQDSQGV